MSNGSFRIIVISLLTVIALALWVLPGAKG